MKLIPIIATLALAIPSVAQQISISTPQASQQPIIIPADANTGLKSIIVAYYTDGATATFTSPSASATVEASTFSNAGAAYCVPVSATRNGNQWTITLPKGDCGVTFDVQGDRQYHYWITDYSIHRLVLTDLQLNPTESDCSMGALSLSGDASPIIYYTINGASKTLSRDLTLSYSTLEYSDNAAAYIPRHEEKALQSASATIHVEQPLCATAFTLSGDRFLRQWGETMSISSPTYQPTAVAAHTSAKNLNTDPDNLSSSASGSGLGGNAPAEVEFTAEVSDAVRFTEWQLSSEPDFGIIDYRFATTSFTHVFEDYGTTYARFVAANDSGDCQFESQSYEISIGASKLQCPNAFSPADQNGVNDEWKVNYASLVEFECNIFNRWGVHIIKLTDPSQGWDGRHGGKFVQSGVYYYVIKARGADGIEYNLSGDINVINTRKKPATATE